MKQVAGPLAPRWRSIASWRRSPSSVPSRRGHAAGAEPWRLVECSSGRPSRCR
jgi:hypothetical protein